MNILYIGKYPPIEGGVSAQNYWRIRGLVQKYSDLNYVVLTNALEVEANYRIPFNSELLEHYNKYSNLKIYNTDPLAEPKFIPRYSPKTEKLLNLGIHLCQKYEFDIIESHYLLPYGLVSYNLSKMHNIPYILRHAGSDLTRLFENPSLNFLLKKVIQNCSALVTTFGMKNYFSSYEIDENIICETSNFRAVDLSLFHNGVNSRNNKVFRIGFIGKPSKGKGINAFFKFIKKLSDEINNVSGVITCSEYGTDRQYLKKRASFLDLDSHIQYMNYHYPWKMPDLYRSLDLVLCPETNFGIPFHNTMIPRESIACGTPCSISREIAQKFPYNLDEENTIFIINWKDYISTIDKIRRLKEDKEFRSNRISEGLKFSHKIENYDKMIKDFYFILQNTLGVI